MATASTGPGMLLLLVALLASWVRAVHIPTLKGDDELTSLWDNPDTITSILVQADFMDGVHTEGIASEDAHQVMATVIGYNEDHSFEVAYRLRPLEVMTTSKQPVQIVMQTSEGWEHFNLTTTPTTFFCSRLGRLTFSIPVSDYNEGLAPTLLFRTPNMKADHWTVAHVDQAMTRRLATLQPSSLASVEGLSAARSEHIAMRVRELYADAHLAEPVAHVVVRNDPPAVQRGEIYQRHRRHDYVPHDESKMRFHWDPATQHITTYTALYARDAAAEVQPQHFHRRLLKRGIDAKGMTVVGHEDLETRYGMLRSTLEAEGVDSDQLIGSVRSYWSWSDIQYTATWLETFFRLVIPLGHVGIASASNVTHLFEEATFKTEDVMNEAISHYAHGETYQQMSAKMRHNARVVAPNQMAELESKVRPGKATSKESQGHQSYHGGNLSSNYVQDHAVMRLENITITDPNYLKQLDNLALVTEMRLKEVLTPQLLDRVKPHLHFFSQSDNLYHKSMAYILEGIKRILIGLELASMKAMQLVMTLLPLWWEMVVAIMTWPLPRTVFDHWWANKVIGDPHTKISPLSLINLIGACMTNVQYNLWHDQPPFTAADAAVFKELKRPTLMLYDWNNDPRTFVPESDTATRTHRLGLYDWILRSSLASLSVIMVAAFNGMMVIGGGTPSNPGPLTHGVQTITSIFSNVFQIAGYPLTQLTSDKDEAAIIQSTHHPDKSFMGQWLVNLTASLIAAVRPMMGKTLNSEPWFGISIIIVNAIPYTLCFIPIMKRTAAAVAPDDFDRKMVVYTMWADVANTYLYYATLFIPKSQSHWSVPIALTGQFVGQAINIFRLNWMMGRNVVGMLSSSYQGDADKADADKADADKGDVSKADADKADASKADAGKADASKADAGKADAGKADATPPPAPAPSDSDLMERPGDFRATTVPASGDLIIHDGPPPLDAGQISIGVDRRDTPPPGVSNALVVEPSRRREIPVDQLML